MLRSSSRSEKVRSIVILVGDGVADERVSVVLEDETKDGAAASPGPTTDPMGGSSDRDKAGAERARTNVGWVQTKPMGDGASVT